MSKRHLSKDQRLARRRRRWKWLIASAVVVLVISAGVVALSLYKNARQSRAELSLLQSHFGFTVTPQVRKIEASYDSDSHYPTHVTVTVFFDGDDVSAFAGWREVTLPEKYRSANSAKHVFERTLDFQDGAKGWVYAIDWDQDFILGPAASGKLRWERTFGVMMH